MGGNDYGKSYKRYEYNGSCGKISDIAQVLMRYGLGCVGCIISSAETLGEGIAVHGLNPDIIIEEVNMILEKQEG